MYAPVNRLAEHFFPEEKPKAKPDADKPANYLEALRQELEEAGDPTAADTVFPMPIETAIEKLHALAYLVPENTILRYFGERPLFLDESEWRLFRLSLETSKLWVTFPGPHDFKKPPGQLSIEIAQWWNRTAKEDHEQWLSNTDPALVCLLACVCAEPQAQQTFLHILLIKMGLAQELTEEEAKQFKEQQQQ